MFFWRLAPLTVCTVLVSLLQCFAWSARVMYLLARVRTRTGTSCAVLRLDSTAMYLLARSRTRTGVRTSNVPTCPCSCWYWYLLCSASLGQHGQCTYLPVVVLVLVPLVHCFAWTARSMYLCARACILVQCLCSALLGQHEQCTYLPVVVLVRYLLCSALLGQHGLCTYRTGTTCAVLCLDSTGNVPTCPWSYSYWYLLCSALLGQHGLCTYVPVLVSLYSVLLWVIRAMYVSSCLDFRAVLVALLLLTWTVYW